MKDLNEVVEKVKNVEDGVTNLIIPILKDTIADGNKHNRRLFITNIILTISLLVVSLVSIIIISQQDKKYADFLSQFEFETEIIQDLDTGENGDIYNPTINN